MAEAPTAAGRLAFDAFPVYALLAATAIAAHGLHAPPLRGSLPAAGRPSGETSKALRAGDGEMSRMRSLVAGAVAMAGAASAAHAQQAVQWRVEDGGNGHWYQLAVMSTPIDWHIADTHAVEHGGHLATISGELENEFVLSASDAIEGWWVFAGSPGYCIGPWLGGYQPVDAVEPAGGWRWVTNEAFSFEHWWQPANEPNDGCGGEDYLCFLTQGGLAPSSWWNDGGGQRCLPQPKSFVIEWSADCNADGIVDYGQIRAGELADSNANNIPDCCETGTPCGCAADLDGNGSVDGIDLAVILNRWGTDGGKDYPNADIDGNGTIDGADLAQILGSWGACP